MSNISSKEMEVQLALGTLSPMKLFLKMLSMQNEEFIKTHDWDDERTPKITTNCYGTGTTTPFPFEDVNIHIELSDKTVFVFNSKEEFVGTYNYK